MAGYHRLGVTSDTGYMPNLYFVLKAKLTILRPRSVDFRHV